jgi:hypothetical protein
MEDVSIFVDIGSIIRPLGILYDHLVYFVAIWYIFLRVGILYQGKSGNPGVDKTRVTNFELAPLKGFGTHMHSASLFDQDEMTAAACLFKRQFHKGPC